LLVVFGACCLSAVAGFQVLPCLSSIRSANNVGSGIIRNLDFANIRNHKTATFLGGRVGFGERQTKSGKQSPLEGGNHE
jgi:hypothetical protein